MWKSIITFLFLLFLRHYRFVQLVPRQATFVGFLFSLQQRLFFVWFIAMVFLSLPLKQHFLKLRKRHFNQHGSHKAEKHADDNNAKVEGENIPNRIVEVNLLTVSHNLDDDVVDEISPERNFAGEVEKFSVQQEEDKVVFHPEESRGENHGGAYHEEELSRCQVQRMDNLWPLMSYLQSSGN